MLAVGFSEPSKVSNQKIHEDDHILAQRERE